MIRYPICPICAYQPIGKPLVCAKHGPQTWTWVEDEESTFIAPGFRDALINTLMGDAWERMYDRLEMRRQFSPPKTQKQADDLRREVYGELADEIITEWRKRNDSLPSHGLTSVAEEKDSEIIKGSSIVCPHCKGTGVRQ